MTPVQQAWCHGQCCPLDLRVQNQPLLVVWQELFQKDNCGTLSDIKNGPTSTSARPGGVASGSTPSCTDGVSAGSVASESTIPEEMAPVPTFPGGVEGECTSAESPFTCSGISCKKRNTNFSGARTFNCAVFHKPLRFKEAEIVQVILLLCGVRALDKVPILAHISQPLVVATDVIQDASFRHMFSQRKHFTSHLLVTTGSSTSYSAPHIGTAHKPSKKRTWLWWLFLLAKLATRTSLTKLDTARKVTPKH